MLNRNYMLAVIFLAAFMVMRSQDGSVETFNAIRLEHSSDPGQTITLSAPTGLVGYTLEYPATAAPIDRRYSLSLNGATGSMTWYATPLGTAGQIPFFESDEELTGSPNLLWDDVNKTMTMSSTVNHPMLKMQKTVALKDSVIDTIFDIDATYTSIGSTADEVEIKLIDFSLDGTGLANGATAYGVKIDIGNLPGNASKPSSATGLYVNVDNVDTARAIIVTNGNTGIGTTQPNVMMDIAGDVAFREYNYTGPIDSTIDIDFDGMNNRHSFVRLGTALTSTATIKGIKGGYSGKMIKLYNATGQTILLRNDGALSAANNIHSSASADLLLLDGNTYELIYSDVEDRWLIAFSGPGELSNLGNKTVGPISNDEVLPSSVASYIQVSTPTSSNPNTYEVLLENGTTPGQILVVQNMGPKTIVFEGTNYDLDNNTNLGTGDSIILIWNGSQWVQVAEASN